MVYYMFLLFFLVIKFRGSHFCRIKCDFLFSLHRFSFLIIIIIIIKCVIESIDIAYDTMYDINNLLLALENHIYETSFVNLRSGLIF